MAYEVLARKYRSRTFDEIVGQSVIAATLKNSVALGRLHHGYLFTGTRGVGKTSMARILAKALNCQASDAPTPTPCCKCESCLRIADGSDLDVVEIDAASNTGVDNIRDLRSNAAYRPARSRFKVYIIDEVHMLSTGAFNALLKTLEEPPDHVKFILATTEAHKVPATIRSRCQRYDFRSISPADIAEQLAKVVEQEGVTAEELVLRRVARLANGSMRDALSILDQLLAYGAQELTSELIEDLLPATHDEVILELFDAVADDDAAAALRCVDRCLTTGYTAERFCDAVIDYLRSLMLLAVCGAETELLDISGSARDRLVAQSGKFDAPSYVYMIALLEQVRRQVKSSSAPRPLIDAAVVRLALASSFSSIADVLSRVGEGHVASPGEPVGAGVGAKKKDARVEHVPAGSIKPAPALAASAKDRGLAGATPPAPRGPVAVAAVSIADRRKALESPLVRAVMERTQGAIAEVRHNDARIARPAVSNQDDSEAPGLFGEESDGSAAEAGVSEGQ